MPVEYTRLRRSRLSREEAAELKTVDEIVKHLRGRLHEKAPLIDAAHVHGASSAAVQSLISSVLRRELKFREEVVLKVGEGFETRVRPDFVRRLGKGRGVIAEIERGGALNGNFDLKDFWKVHIAPDAHHLVIVVPRANWNAANGVREMPYERVAHRLASFFGDTRREVDVVSCHVLGYGRVKFARPSAAAVRSAAPASAMALPRPRARRTQSSALPS